MFSKSPTPLTLVSNFQGALSLVEANIGGLKQKGDTNEWNKDQKKKSNFLQVGIIQKLKYNIFNEL